MASFPTSVFAPANRSNGQTIDASHMNGVQDEIVAIEDGYRNATAPLNSSNSTIVNLSVTGGSTLANLNVTSGSTFVGSVNITTSTHSAINVTNSTHSSAVITGVLTYGVSVLRYETNSTQGDIATLSIPSTSQILRLSAGVNSTIHGISTAADGRSLVLQNVTSTLTIVLKTESGSAGAAAQRLAISGDLTLASNEGIRMWYDGDSARWRAVAF